MDHPKQTDSPSVGKPAPVRVAELHAQLKTSSEGLSQAEAQRRLAQYGYNELSEKRRNPLLEFLSHFCGPIPWMVKAAAILSALVRIWADFVIILVLLLANAAIRFWEEFQVCKAIAVLKANLALKARVRRDVQWRALLARELVPGGLFRAQLS